MVINSVVLRSFASNYQYILDIQFLMSNTAVAVFQYPLIELVMAFIGTIRKGN
jgi:hypothetical protein